MERREYASRNDAVIKSINKLRQTSNEMRQMYQAIVDKNPESVFKHNIWMLDQEAELLDMLENSVILNDRLAEIILQSRQQVVKRQEDKKLPAGPRIRQSKDLVRKRPNRQRKNRNKKHS